MLTNELKKAVPILERLVSAGFEAYFVGGCVRNLLLNEEINDIDITTSASAEEVQAIFKKVIPVGLMHGTVIVRYQKESYEVTSFRSNELNSLPIEQRTLIEDLRHRDFTMNAIALNKDGKIIDLFAGREDIELQTIRAVDNPQSRLTEDPLRIIRAVRFESQFGFTIEKKTLQAMHEKSALLADVAVERVTAEITKLFQGKYIAKAIATIHSVGIDQYLPIFKWKKNLLSRLPQDITAFDSFIEVIAFFHQLDESISIAEWVKNWKCSNKTKRAAENLVWAVREFKETGLTMWLVYRLLSDLDKSFAHLVTILYTITSIDEELLTRYRERLPINCKDELQFSGNDVLAIYPNEKPGPWIHDIIERIEKAVVTQEIENDKNIIKEWIKCHPPGEN